MRKINNPVEDGHEMITTVHGRTASPHYVRSVLSESDIIDLIKSYRSGATARALTEHYGVHVSTIKKKLAKHYVRR